jgi:hypothetical protein
MIRDLTKSMLSFSWAMSLFGMKQMSNLMTLPGNNQQPFRQATEAFNAVTEATEAQLEGIYKEAFRTGDNLQKNATDMAMQWTSMESYDTNQILRWPMDMMRRMNESLQHERYSGATASGVDPDVDSEVI